MPPTSLALIALLLRVQADPTLRLIHEFGRLVALVSNAGSTTPVVDVFSPQGRFLGTVRPAEKLSAFVVRGRRAIALSESTDGEHVVHVYRIE